MIFINSMRSFKLDDWKNENIVTRDGRKVRVICIDRLCGRHGGPVIGLVKGKSGKYEQVIQYDKQGRQAEHAAEYDLMIDDET